MQAKKADKTEITTQYQLCKAIYDKKYRLKVTPSLTLPKQLWSLLDTKECTIVQKKWLMFYCANRGNYVDACVKTKVRLPTYRSWRNPTNRSLSNMKFREAQKEVQDAFTEVGESKLKEMVASKNSAAVIFYMKNQHESYKPTVKMIEEAKKDKEKGIAKLVNLSPEKKSDAFNAMMGHLKVDNNEENKVD